MNWFQKHLNWTWVLAYLFMVLIQFVIGAEGIEAKGVGSLLGVTIMLPISGWVIVQKGRSLWWILLSGLFSPLWLKNKTKKSESLNS